MAETSLLNTLRQIAGSKPVLASQGNTTINKPNYANMTDFSSLPDYASYQSMVNVFEKEGRYADFYFLSRSGKISDTITTDKGEKVLFSGYNYLGLGCDQRIIDYTNEATNQYGSHAGAARMVGGEIDLHRDLEQAMAEFSGHEDCVVGVSGYAANVAVLSYLLGKQDLLIHDSYMHNSGISGGIQSGAKRLSFGHNDLDALETILKLHRDSAKRAIILVEGAYSMDGDIIDLPRILALKKQYGCWLMVDEAHSLGTSGKTGRGISEHWGTDPKEIDIVMGTLSKSFASCGGFICGSKQLIALLRIYAPGMLLYSTGISPANTAAAYASLKILTEEPERVTGLQHNARLFCHLAKQRGLDIGDAKGLAPIVPVSIGEDLKALRVATTLFENDIIAHPILYPVVPKNEAKIRFFITLMHTEEQMVRTLDIITEELNGTSYS